MIIHVADLSFKKMIDYDAINTRCQQIGAELTLEYEACNPIFIGVLNGSFMFIAELMKYVDIPAQVAFMKLSSYAGGLESKRVITDEFDLSVNIEDRDVILVEDIVDTGNTLRYLIDKIQTRKPKSVSTCTLLYKPDAVELEIPELKHVGFEIENKFVVGFGLDYKELGRNLKDIYQLVL
ncbi:hypoxanthine phosphoribosyltransferase [Mucilaginibacter gracilis]|uniref:Hypoxanthine phosphoribosyltransferase n=1 Tax=Mucilaginibacter gracilis TaxID=423350 RepID=A0A495IWW0_9SPHI|nr:hypoxanthine phosphoribosyltransferase [Mucilaginibacter gracilis]RKR81160.1 hypoxanthine phosphoribosyltransferase [Mucilaginibacter gracilis]